MKSPFKFLDSYSKEDVNIFFGREKDVEEIYEKLFKSNLLLIYGASGTGKTSIVNCGIANKFLDTDWFPVHIRRKNNILESARAEIEKLAVTPIPVNRSLTDAVYSLYLDFFKPVYLVFDQFEELFISGDKNEQDGFTDFLVSLLDKRYNVKVIITVREEYLAYFALFEERLPDFFDNRYRVEFITRYKAEDIIVKTCRQAGIEIRDGKVVPEKIVTNVLSGAGKVELTYLQVYLDRLYNQYCKTNSPEEVVFSEALVDEVGDISDVLSLFLEEQIEKTNDQVFAWQMLKAFITENGTKKITTPASVKKYFEDNGKQIDEGKIAEYTSKFLQLKIIKPVDENKTYEITHDSLAGKIWERVSADDRAVFEVKTLISDAYKKHLSSNNTLLLRSEDLAYIKPYENKLILTTEEDNFLKKSRKRVINRRAGMATIVTSVIIVLSLLTLYLFNTRREVTEALNAANIAKRNADNSNLELKAQKTAADLLKIEADRQKDTALASKQMADSQKIKAQDATSIAQRAEQNARAANEQAQNEKANSVHLLQHTRAVLDVTNLLQTDPTQAKNDALNIYPQITEPKLKAVLRQTVYAAFSGVLYEKKQNFNIAITSFATDDDKSFAIVAGKKNELLYYNIKTGEKAELKNPHRFPITAISISNSSKNFVTADETGKIVFWSEAKKVIKTVENSANDVAALQGINKGELALVAYKNGDISVYDFKGNLKKVMPSQSLRTIESLKNVNTKYGNILTTGGNNVISIWKLPEGETSRISGYKSTGDDKINDADVSPDGRLIAIATNKKTLIYTLGNGPKLSIEENIVSLNSVAPVKKVIFLHPAEIIFLVEGGDVVYYNLETGKRRNIQNSGGTDAISTIIKPGNLSTFVSAAENGEIKFWNTNITEPVVFDFTYKDEGKILSATSGGYVFSKNEKEVTFEDEGKKIKSTFKLVKDQPGQSDGLSLTNTSSFCVLTDSGEDVQRYLPFIPPFKCTHITDGKKSSSTNQDKKDKTLAIKSNWLSEDGYYVLLEITSSIEGDIYYVVYPTFNSIESFTKNKK